MKPGYKTTEFWLSFAAVLIGAMLASGAFVDGGTAAKILGGAGSVLAALGYTAGRSFTKATESQAAAAREIAAAHDPLASGK